MLIFFDLEWAAADDDHVAGIIGDPQLDFCRHHLEQVRLERPHLLSEAEETGFDPEGLIHTVSRLNKQIADPNYSVGITFFLGPDIEEEIEDIWNMEILPYLGEYFFDSPSKVAEFEWDEVEKAILSWSPKSDT